MTALIGMRCRSASAGSATGQPTILPVVRSLYETSTSTVSFIPRGWWRAWSSLTIQRRETDLREEKLWCRRGDWAGVMLYRAGLYHVVCCSTDLHSARQLVVSTCTGSCWGVR